MKPSLVLFPFLSLPLFAHAEGAVSFLCGDGTAFSVQFSGDARGTATLTLNGQTQTLKRQQSASGVRYSNGRTTLSVKGQQAALERKGQGALRDCGEQERLVSNGVFSDPATGMRIAALPNWSEERVRLFTARGEDARARQPGAEVWVSFDYVPTQPGEFSQSLARVVVFPRADWDRLATESAVPPGEILAQTETRVYAAILPQSNPYAPGSVDAIQFGALSPSSTEFAQAFSVQDGRVPPATAARITPPPPPPPPPAVAPPVPPATVQAGTGRQEAAPAAVGGETVGKLVCAGRDPSPWSLVFNDDGSARLKTSMNKPGQVFELRGATTQIDFTDPRQSVWRGERPRQGKVPASGPWVALLREEACRDDQAEPSAQSALLSAPDGRVLIGCCRVAR